jgi:xanthine dehydrogenase YagS FAD-binding subunit
MNRFAWGTAGTIAEAAAAAGAVVAEAMATSPPRPAGSVVKAGGIDVLDLLKEGILATDRLVGLSDVPGLGDIAEAGDGGMRIGAAATLARLAAYTALRRRYPALAEAAEASASPQIRNVATLGGNLLQRPRCWYFRSAATRCLRKGGGHCFALAGENQYHAIFGNGSCAIVHPSTAATVLVALGASVELVSAEGAVRSARLEDFFVSPDTDVQRENDLRPNEILTAILLPGLPASVRMVHLKQGQRQAFDWPLADVAVVLDTGADGRCSQAAVVLGAAAPVPYRAKGTEAALLGSRVDAAVVAAAARAALNGATPLSGNGYKLPLFEALVRRAILKVCDIA